MYSVLWADRGQIRRLGPFETQPAADRAAREAYAGDDLDDPATFVYLLTPTHEMRPYTEADLRWGGL